MFALMCGIAGIQTANGAPPDPAALARLRAALAHRGPDGSGETIAGDTALVHTRLAIIDLATGDQPLYRDHAALIANGEIYNDPALRARMPGTHFATGSDCEPPLHLHATAPETFARELRGMYAIAIHDRAAGTLTLSRDPFGIKPLYTCLFPGGLAFASEPAALVAAGLAPARIFAPARAALLQMQFSPGRHTIFPGIERVLPGETLTIRDAAIVARTLLPALPDGAPTPTAETSALAALDAALMDSVAAHLRSDVPFGMFLSGGIDSAAVLACMSRLGLKPLAFTAGFDVPGAADEREAAATLARSVGAHHEPLTIARADVFRHLPEIVACMDDPAADYAIIPTWFLARRARSDVKMVLSGEGGDELFAGYGRYRRARRPAWLGGRRMRARGTFEGLDVLADLTRLWRTDWAAAERDAATEGRTALQAAQAADTAEWLPNDLLLKLDRCLMAHGVEGRTPFLDPAVAAAAFRLPDALKIQGRLGKHLLRVWLAANLPAARPFARKQGFTVPIADWIAADAARLAPLLAANPGLAEIARPGDTNDLFTTTRRGTGTARWMLLFYALWHAVHILGVNRALPTEDVLRDAARSG